MTLQHPGDNKGVSGTPQSNDTKLELDAQIVDGNNNHNNTSNGHAQRHKRGWLAAFDELVHRAAAMGRVELRGISPIPVVERTSTKTINVFTLWWSMSTNILPYEHPTQPLVLCLSLSSMF